MNSDPLAANADFVELLRRALGAQRAKRFITTAPFRLDVEQRARMLDAGADTQIDIRRRRAARAELERAHREELALLLRWVCYRSIVDNAELSLTCMPPRVSNAPQPPSEDELDARVQRVCANAPQRGPQAQASRWLACAGVGETATSLLQVAALAQQLAPTAQVDVYCAIELIRCGRFDAAHFVGQRAVANAHSARVAALAWAWTGVAHARAGNLAACAEALETALRETPADSTPAMLLLEMALALEDDALANRACEHLDSALGVSTVQCDWFCAGADQRTNARDGQYRSRVTNSARRLVARVAGSASNRIVNYYVHR